MWPLEFNSEICLAGLNKKVFVFISREATSDNLPPKLATKYMVRKVMQNTACCEIRLSFMMSDLHSVAIKIIWNVIDRAVETASFPIGLGGSL